MLTPIVSIILLIVLGFGLLAIELFVTPGFGLLGILGIGALIGGGVAAYYMLGPFWGILVFALSFTILIVGIFLFVKSGSGRKFILNEVSGREEIKENTITGGEKPVPIGAAGKAITTLRPVGVVEVDGERYDAIAEAEYIEAGTSVVLLRVQGFQVVVAIQEKVEPREPAES